MKTYVYRSVTLTSYTTGEGENKSASSPYGPVKAGLITSQRTDKEVQLLELLNSLERKVETLVSKSSKVLDISLRDTTHLVEPSASITATISTK